MRSYCFCRVDDDATTIINETVMIMATTGSKVAVYNYDDSKYT